MELKLADNWSGDDLFERLESQLIGDYLRDGRSNRGIFVLVYRGIKLTWKVSTLEVEFTFPELVDALQNYWNRISERYFNIEEVKVIGVDLTKRGSGSRQRRQKEKFIRSMENSENLISS